MVGCGLTRQWRLLPIGPAVLEVQGLMKAFSSRPGNLSKIGASCETTHEEAGSPRDTAVRKKGLKSVALGQGQ